MKTVNAYLSVSVISLIFTVDVLAAGISDDAYKAGKDRIASVYKTEKEDCDKLTGNTKDVCIAEAKGKESIAKAQLEMEKDPTPKTQYNISIAKAEADYTIAKVQCDANEGDVKDICQKAAKDAYNAAKSKAKMQMGGDPE